MNIDKAIKNLKAAKRDCGMIPSNEYSGTIRLAQGALEEIKYLREIHILHEGELLPGETKI
jgi:predicted transcriptional regulator